MSNFSIVYMIGFAFIIYTWIRVACDEHFTSLAQLMTKTLTALGMALLWPVVLVITVVGVVAVFVDMRKNPDKQW